MHPVDKWVTECPDPEAWSAYIADFSVQAPSGCHIWTGPRDRNGYGLFKMRSFDRTWRTGAHRAAYVSTVGPIPYGLVIDHLCRVPRCVNPLHLDPVTSLVNTQRAAELGKMKGTTGRKLGMIQGCRTHGLENGYVRPTKRKNGMGTEWLCRICERARQRRIYWRKKGVDIDAVDQQASA